MKSRTAFCLAAMLFFGCPTVGSAAFLIELKNGSRIVTERYWEEGSDIKFYRFGGVMGVAKDTVAKISDTDKAVDKGVESGPEVPVAGANESDAATGETSGEPTQPDSQAQQQPSEEEYYMQKRRQLEGDTKAALSRFKELSSQENNPERAEAWKTFSENQRKLSDLEDELKEKYSGTLPSWWMK